MKNYAKVGNRRGKPAYRTPSSFRFKQVLKTRKACSCRHKSKNGNY